jgi:hypothetical protein
MAIGRASIFAGTPTYLSDEQIEAAAIKWLQLLKSTTYAQESAPAQPKHRVYFAGENKKFLLTELEREHPTWERDFIAALTCFLTTHRRDKHLTLHYDYEAEDLLEDFVDSVAFLRGKRGLFPIKTTMTFDDDDNVFINGIAVSAADIIDPSTESNEICDKLGCPRFMPALQKFSKLLGR